MTLLEARLRSYGLSLRSYVKVAHHKKFLEIDFMGGLFYENLANSKIYFTSLEACKCLNCKYKPKIRNLLSLNCSAHQMLSKIVFHDPLAPTTMEEMHI